jgi:hypothetical protein
MVIGGLTGYFFLEEHVMKKLLVALLLMSFVPAAFAAVFNDDMSSLALWGQGSAALNEYDAGGGGIYLVDQDEDTFMDGVQMNSWADGAGYTDLWADTGVVIADETDYTLTITMQGLATDVAVPISLQAIDALEVWSVLASVSAPVIDAAMADYSVTFSTVGAANDAFVGQSLAIGISPGWWNNLVVDNVAITVPEPVTLSLIGLGGLLIRRKK